MRKLLTNINFWIICIFFMLLFVLHYDQQIPYVKDIGILNMLHIQTRSIERILFIIPIGYMAYVFGAKAGIFTLIIVFFAILPRALFLEEHPPDAFGEAVLAMAVALIFTLWLETRRREVKQQRQLINERTEKIIQKQKAEQALSELASIVNSSDDAIIGFGMDGVITSFNSGTERIFKRTKHSIMGTHISKLIAHYRHDLLDRIFAVIKKGRHEHDYESVVIGQNKVDLSITISPVKDEKGDITSASLIARDITEQKNLEREILEISSREQERLGQILHDSLGQHLTGLSFKCKVLEKKIQKLGIDGLREPHEIAELINQAIQQTRTLSKGLLYFELEDKGLVNALQELTSATENLYGIRTHFMYDGRTVVDDNNTAVQLYRIAREAVHNAVKHGRPSTIKIRFGAQAGGIVLVIKDDGTGTGAALDQDKGLGLRIMKHRSDIIGASLRIRADNNKGVTVRCELPLR
ncbi:MAG: PAS domain S-box protein [Spirochaetales bacterium]|nr:PAS domain S-box protein [Spirochaetales bacterium]